MNFEDTVLATVNGKEIRSSQLELLLNQAPEEQQKGLRTREGRRQLLEEMIGQEMFYLEGIEQNIEETEAFQKELQEAKEKLIKARMIANFMAQFTVEEDEVRAYYDANPHEFVAPHSVRAAHILVPAKQQAIDIIKEIKSGEKTFQEAARAYSMCPSKDQGGDLGFFPRGKMVPAFEAAAFNLAVGEMTEEPIKTDFGYHIIHLIDERKHETIPFEYVKETLHKWMLGQKQNREYNARIQELKEKYNVTVRGMI